MTRRFGGWSGWWEEWGVLALVAVVALPLFTPRVYASDEIKYYAALRSVYFDRDLHYENEYADFIRRDPVAHAGLVPFMEGSTPTGYRLNDAPIGTAIMSCSINIASSAPIRPGAVLHRGRRGGHRSPRVRCERSARRL